MRIETKPVNGEKEHPLMQLGDRLFAPMMLHASVDAPETALKMPFTLELGLSDEEIKARYDAWKSGNFELATRRRTPNHIVRDRNGRAKPAVGLGAAALVATDSEYTAGENGRNRQLSVQFCLLGATGESITQVIHLTDDDYVDQRPALSQCLADLIELAMDEDVLEDWPSEVILAGFLTRADLPAFSDFKHFLKQVDGVGGTFASIKRTADTELPLRSDTEARLKQRYSGIVGDDFNPRIMNIRLIDVSRLAPPGKPLEVLGEWIGLPKLDLPPGFAKDRMDIFQRKDRQAFEQYAIRDAEIVAYYLLWVWWYGNRHLGLNDFSATIGSLGVRYAEACMLREGVAPDIALNYRQVKTPRWNRESRRAVTRKLRIPQQIRKWLESFMADAFRGGRNECYTFGPSRVQKYFDPDLNSAYVTALSYLMVMDYDRARQSNDPQDFCGHVAGYALVDFTFPAETRFPCLPVDTPHGLLFPLQGQSLCTAPEIELALSMGATLNIRWGFVVPWMSREEVFSRSEEAISDKQRQRAEAWRDEYPASSTVTSDDIGYRLFEPFTTAIRDNRAQYRRGTLPFEFNKLLGNSAYGKIGQGYKDKRAYGPREQDYVPIGPSRISDPGLAALVCGFVRAVLGEILSKIPPEVEVISATTDGFLVSCPLDQLDLSGVMCQRFAALVERVTPGASMLECKHIMMQVLAIRTRGQVTLQKHGNDKFVTAKAGIKPPEGTKDQNEYMIDLFLDRKPGQKHRQTSFIPLQKQAVRALDLQKETHDITLNLEFDFKRRPINPCMRPVGDRGVEHLAFDTEPWQTADEALLARVLFQGWRDSWRHEDNPSHSSGCLKTLADWENWQAFDAFRTGVRQRARQRNGKTSAGATRQGQLYLTGKDYLGLTIRLFLAAFVRRAWGLDDLKMSQSALVQWMDELGHPIKLSAVKNASRTELQEHAVPATGEVTKFLDVLRQRFPSLETHRFLAEAC